ncbi:methyltransferase domain-containing protein [Sphingomonas sp. MAH-20]|uniref:Methyltransferase domain-containing protein n=1 Tax=Sphingomonas horti TaxID=2682842 RepID=A0A6I4J1D4_9SPHN|nr:MULTISPECIES: methyltransferase domain-containing protein [Sphingomonas]MBA2919997.1 methyltransferase domain-containing protein [Sphingomonas sp. CGMCC 1.13658]MVO77878.1 methyltransferase domain-containing protein [Sphingomonas horti]
MSAPQIFDRRRRRLRRDRAATGFASHDFLHARMAAELLDRLDSVQRQFTRALDLGCLDGRVGRALAARGIESVAADAGFRFARAGAGVQCDEDQLPFADGSFDLIVACGGLDQVNDLPGALTLIRRVLKPDGLFLGAFVGAGSLPRLRAALLGAEDRAVARLHPQIDVRSAGDLLARAGFALPVADGERLAVRYGSLFALLADLRGSASASLLADAAPPLTRSALARAAGLFQAAADPDGKVAETIEIVHLLGWAPAPDQPRPARRGSGTASLADALRPKRD